MATNDPLILALSRNARALKKNIGDCQTLESKLMAIQHARDTLRQIEVGLVKSGYASPTAAERDMFERETANGASGSL